MGKLHVISGLPRAGSTLLAALLRQNPRFSASVTSPLALLATTLQQKMCGAGEFTVFFDDARRRAMMRALFDTYYADAPEVVFDTNRSWTGKAALLDELYPGARIIACVRDIGWIIDSIERMLAKNPLQHSRIFDFKPGASVYGRSEMLMNPECGLIGEALQTLREMWFGPFAHKLILVRYDSLAADPAGVLTRLYDELGEPAFEHDFEGVSYDEPEYDAALGMPGLHRVRPKVIVEERTPSIPPDLFARHASANFWARPELNVRNVVIL